MRGDGFEGIRGILEGLVAGMGLAIGEREALRTDGMWRGMGGRVSREGAFGARGVIRHG